MEPEPTRRDAKKRLRRIVRWGGIVAVVVVMALIVTARMAGIGCAGREPLPLAGPQTIAGSDLLAGDWQGSWKSSERDMGGAMTCRIRKLEPEAYEATFDAVFYKVLNNHSVVKLSVKKAAGGWEFSGQKDLGFLKGGVYRYNGRCDGKQFVCAYDSKYDKGTFTMARSRPGNAP